MFVEFADQGQHTLVAEGLEPRLIGRQADDRRRVDLPVGGVDDEPGGGADREGGAFRNRMGDGDELDDKRADSDFLALGDDVQRNLGRAWLAETASLGQPGRKPRHVDRRAEVRPELGERADVILVRMGDDDSDQIPLHLLDEAEVWHDKIDAGQLRACKGHSEIDHQPLARVCRSIAVKGAIHADLAQAAKRGEHELAVVRHLGSALRRVGRRPGRRLGGRSRRETEVGRLDALAPALGAHEQATAGIDPLEEALTPAGASLDRDVLPNTAGAVEPGSANAVERPSLAPGPERLVKPLGQALEHLGRADRLPARADEARGRVAKPFWRMRAIDADPHRIRGAPAGEANPFDEDAGAFGAVQHKIVRPFEAGVGRAGIACSARQRHAGDEAELRRERGGTRINQERGGVKVAPR